MEASLTINANISMNVGDLVTNPILQILSFKSVRIFLRARFTQDRRSQHKHKCRPKIDMINMRIYYLKYIQYEKHICSVQTH